MTFWDSAASAARWMARVVFPLPPFWEITAIVFTSASTPVCQPTCLLATRLPGKAVCLQAGKSDCMFAAIFSGRRLRHGVPETGQHMAFAAVQDPDTAKELSAISGETRRRDGRGQ